MLYKTILCASDGFEHSDRALRHAGTLAADTGAALHVIHVADPPLTAALLGGEYIHLTPAERRMRITTQIAQLATGEGMAVHRHFMFQRRGSVAVQIARLADEIDADVIVVGSRGRAPLSAALIGSEAQRLPHQTTRPILVVPGDEVHHATRQIRAVRAHRRPRVPPAITAAPLGDRR
jgi:nucleotide-binding universal stress UspA family protein